MKHQTLALSRAGRSRGLCAAVAALLTLAGGNAFATGFPIGLPTPVAPGFSCRDFDTENILRELSIAPIPDGPVGHSDGTLSLATVYYDTTDGPILDWYQSSTGQSIHHVIIQGANGGYAYSYDPIVTSDRNLHMDPVPTDDPLAKPLYEGQTGVTFCYSLPPVSYNGCTLGYWKQTQHFASWPNTIATTNNLRSYFGANAYSDTLLNALNYKGGNGVDGGKRILLKQAAAALLNAASPVVDYRLTQAEVMQYVSFALDSGDRDVMVALAATLDGYNNQSCPLN